MERKIGLLREGSEEASSKKSKRDYLSPCPNTGRHLRQLCRGTIDVIREVDLTGNTTRELSLAQLEQSLSAQRHSFTMQGFHHDVLPLPNGHVIVLADTGATVQELSESTGTAQVVWQAIAPGAAQYLCDWCFSRLSNRDLFGLYSLFGVR
jgi:hypothetical protein